MRPLRVSGYVIQGEGDAFVITFENSASETRVKLGRALARKFSSELDGLLENTRRVTFGHSRLSDSQ
jgi:hypothetical protein